MKKYKGKAIFEGIASGEIRVITNEQTISKRSFKNFDTEFNRFVKAREKEIAKLDSLFKQTQKTLGLEKAKLFETHKIMALDLDFEDTVKKYINQKMLAEEAVVSASKEFANMLSSLDDPYMKARSADVIEVGNGIANILSGKEIDTVLTKPTIIVCQDLESATIMQFDKTMLKGLVLTKGNLTAHISIFARSIGLTSICMVKELKLDKSLNGKKAIVDSSKNEFLLEPDDKTIKEYITKSKQYEKERIKLRQFIGKPTVSADGIKTKIYCNITSASETVNALNNDGEGIGLFRSEYVYLKQKDYPTEDYQFDIYKRAVESMKGREVVIRTLDIGADKKIEYFNLPQEDNPALGYRSVRICLDRPEMFKTQLRALYRASVYGKLSIMVPMITSVDEVKFCKKCIQEVKAELDKKKIAYSKHVRFGIMIEVPAAAIIADELAQYVDFFSIGTNDLTQYTIACDRLNPNLTKINNPYHKAILRLVKHTIESAHKYNKTVGMCGELARDPYILPFLLALHIDEISLSTAYVLKTRKLISEIDTSKVDINKYIK